MLALAGGSGGLGGGIMGGNLGMVGNLGMGLGMGAMGMSPQEYAFLDNAVKSVVGTHASPDMTLLTYASQQGGPPRTIFQMLGYVPFLQNIARNVGLQPSLGSSSQQTGTSAGQNIDNIIMQRAVQLMTSGGLATQPMLI